MALSVAARSVAGVACIDYLIVEPKQIIKAGEREERRRWWMVGARARGTIDGTIVPSRSIEHDSLVLLLLHLPQTANARVSSSPAAVTCPN